MENEFMIYFSGEPPFRKGTIIRSHGEQDLVVLKVYKKRWWKKFARILGFKVIEEGVKVKII